MRHWRSESGLLSPEFASLIFILALRRMTTEFAPLISIDVAWAQSARVLGNTCATMRASQLTRQRTGYWSSIQYALLLFTGVFFYITSIANALLVFHVRISNIYFTRVQILVWISISNTHRIWWLKIHLRRFWIFFGWYDLWMLPFLDVTYLWCFDSHSYAWFISASVLP